MGVTVDLPEPVLARLEAEARGRGVRVEDLAAEVLAGHVGVRRRLRFVAAGASTSGRRASDAKQILADEGFGIDSADR